MTYFLAIYFAIGIGCAALAMIGFDDYEKHNQPEADLTVYMLVLVLILTCVFWPLVVLNAFLQHKKKDNDTDDDVDNTDNTDDTNNLGM